MAARLVWYMEVSGANTGHGDGRINGRKTERASGKTATPVWGHKTF
jgi:hypothetical protein